MAKRKKSRTPAPPTSGRTGRKPAVPGFAAKGGPRPKASAGGNSLSRLDPRKLRFLLAGGVGLVVIVVVVIAVTVSGGGTGGPAAALAAAGCELFEPASFEGSPEHVLEVPADYEFTTFPWTTGVMHPEQVLFNLYPQPVPQLNVVHNLEHGGIYAQYGDQVSDENVAAIAQWWQSDPNGLVVGPLPELGENIALGAWTTEQELDYDNSVGRLAYCARFDQAAFDAFKRSYRGKGPERVPVNALTPPGRAQ